MTVPPGGAARSFLVRMRFPRASQYLQVKTTCVLCVVYQRKELASVLMMQHGGNQSGAADLNGCVSSTFLTISEVVRLLQGGCDEQGWRGTHLSRL